MIMKLYDSSKNRPRVADRTPAEEEEYKKNMVFVRDEVKLIRDLVNKEIITIEPTDFIPAIETIGADLVKSFIDDERPHRKICQGRAASCKPDSARRWSYTMLAVANSNMLSRALAVYKGLPDPGKPLIEKKVSADGSLTFITNNQEEVKVESDWSKQLAEIKEQMFEQKDN